MIDVKDFIISKEALEHINDEDALMKDIAEGKTLQEIFGFSNAMMLELYEAAKSILEQGRFVDAASTFSFLTTLNPYVSDFWVGLGMAQQNGNDYESAIFSFEMAFTLEGGTITPYMLAAQCFMEMGDSDRAIAVLELAGKYAEEHCEEEGCKKLKLEVSSAKKYVKSKSR